MLMDKLPTELFIEFLFSIDDLNALKNFCQINKGARELCRKYRVAICKKFLQRYQVDYNDPTNFIYVMNKEKKKKFFKDGEPEYCRLLFLYSKFYDKKEIWFEHGRFAKKVTSMPLYPNVKSLVCYENDLKSLPDGMRNLTHLDCNSNELTSLPNGMIKLKSLSCHFNKLTSFPNDLFSLEWLNCDGNKLTSLPKTVINLKTVFCKNNLLEALPNGMVNLTLLSCGNNLLTSLPKDMKKLKNLTCSNDRLTLRGAGNQFTSAHLQDLPANVNAIGAYKKYVADKTS